jgi:N-acetyl-gamma-glutamyl-phosphate reductase
MKKIDVAIIGASGYTGLELIKILIQHPNFNINYVATSEGNKKLTELHSSLDSVFEIDVKKVNISEVAEKSELVFLALPHKTAMEFVQKLMRFKNLKIIDLSADYRLEQKTYEEHYLLHTDSENLANSVYGIPELFRQEISNTRLVANAGCYPTASILAILPFLKYKKKGSPIIIDAKSGVSGAGKKYSDSTHFVNINDNMFAYNPLKHRHSPEIAEKLSQFGNEKYKVHFVPHLVPVTRGMLASIYFELESEINPLQILKDFYQNEQFIRIRENPVTMKNTVGTNFCDIFAKSEDKFLYIESSIDNLLRGASSQAVANANIMFGIDENIGIPVIASF